VVAGLGLCLVLLACVLSAHASGSRMLHVHLTGIVNPVAQRHLRAALDRAAQEGDAFVLVSIDTPGGLVSSMQEITTALTNAPVPVIGFVEPRSAQATSAGAFILLATDLIAMAPGTRVGSAHPVAEGKPLEGVLDEKATNSLAALAKSLAERHGRPVALAEEIVRKSTSLTDTEARAAGLAELTADDLPDLLRRLDGRTVRFRGGAVTLRTAGIEVTEFEMTWFERPLDALAEPTVASLLVSIGLAGIVYEFAAPGVGLGGILGAISLLLGLLGLSVLPLAIGGVALLVAGFAAIAVEVKVPSHGLVAGGGTIALLFGALLLVDPSRYFGGVPRVHWQLFGPVLVLVIAAVLLLSRVARRAQRSPVQTGVETLVGRQATVTAPFVPTPEGAAGTVFVDGARWQAESRTEHPRGATVEVVAVLRQPLRLEVKALEKGTK
jgi:membrane-bound serine protease (ClpP class)